MKWLALLGASAIHMCFGQSACPWLNAATASGVLEGAATVRAASDSCHFVAKTGQLQIQVKSTQDAEREIAALAKRCKRDAAPLKAIGNAAFACLHRDREVVVGRVRQQVFTITLVMKGADADKDALVEKARLVAEEVSGALF